MVERCLDLRAIVDTTPATCLLLQDKTDQTRRLLVLYDATGLELSARQYDTASLTWDVHTQVAVQLDSTQVRQLVELLIRALVCMDEG
jgi:hypothetical protein